MDMALLFIPALAVVLFPMLTTGNVGPCNCLDVRLAERSPCGSPGISFDLCKAAGCCYDPRFTNRPACYMNVITSQIGATNEQQLEQEQRSREQKELDEFCRKCRGHNGGLITGVIGALFGSNRSPDCDKCKG